MTDDKDEQSYSRVEDAVINYFTAANSRAFHVAMKNGFILKSLNVCVCSLNYCSWILLITDSIKIVPFS